MANNAAILRSSGISGYSGYSGATGPSGTGVSGFSGYSGFSGFSGPTGVSGFSGFSGPTGVSGFSGFSGYSGPTGVSGFSGFSGYSGPTGVSGFSGFSGLPGSGTVFYMEFVIDGGGQVITSGSKGVLEVPYTSTPQSWTLIGNLSGSLSVDVRRSTYANWTVASALTSASSIVGTEKPTLTSASKNQDTSLTTWSGLTAGDLLLYHVDATPSTVTRATLSIKAQVL